MADRSHFPEIPDPVTALVAETAPPEFRTPSPTRRQVTRRRRSALILGLGWAAVVILHLGPRSGLFVSPGPILAQAGLWLGLGALGLQVALAPVRRGLGTPAWIAVTTAIALPLVFLGLAFIWVPGAQPNGEVGPAQALIRCLGTGVSVAIPGLWLAAWALRRAFVSLAGWRGAAIGVACGLVGGTVLTLHCGITSSGHIALGHGLPVVAGALVGGWLLARLGKA